MKRQLTSREVILIVLLVVISVIGGYSRLFYIPMMDEQERLKNETALCEEQITIAQAQIADKKQKKQVLDAIFAANPNPLSLASYNNAKAVMDELNAILQPTLNYSLSFGAVDDSAVIVRRAVTLSFSAASYENAKQVLSKLGSSKYRCMISDMDVSMQGEEAPVSVNASLLYFEYQENPPQVQIEAPESSEAPAEVPFEDPSAIFPQ